MSDIVKRQMQAETEANGEIRAKDFKHTSAYRIVAEGIDPEVSIQTKLSSGEAIRQQLIKRAKAQSMGINLSYETSNLANGSYRNEAFDSYNKEKRDILLGKRKKKHSTKRYSRDSNNSNQDNTLYKSPYKKDSDSKQKNDNSSNNQSLNFRNQARERFGSAPDSKPKYNPFA